MWPENIPILSMLPHAFAEHGKARGAWGNYGLPMNSMLFPMLPIPGKPIDKTLYNSTVKTEIANGHQVKAYIYRKNTIYSTVRFTASDRRTVQVPMGKTSGLFQQERPVTCIRM